jgi:hypothetical protein
MLFTNYKTKVEAGVDPEDAFTDSGGRRWLDMSKSELTSELSGILADSLGSL